MARRKKETKGAAGHVVRSQLPANRENMKKAGKRAWKNGITLERAVEAYAKNVLDDFDGGSILEAEIFRNHDAMQKARGRGGNMTAFTSGISPCDFSFFANSNVFDHVCSGLIEAKSRNKKSITKSALSHHQKNQLIRMEKLGKCGLVLVSLLDQDQDIHYFIVPITNWFRGRKKSHNISDLQQIGYDCKIVTVYDDNGKDYQAPDIIDVLKRIDADFTQYDDYFPVPPEYAEQYDNRKLKNKIYSTIDKDFDFDEPDIDDLD